MLYNKNNIEIHSFFIYQKTLPFTDCLMLITFVVTQGFTRCLFTQYACHLLYLPTSLFFLLPDNLDISDPSGFSFGIIYTNRG